MELNMTLYRAGTVPLVVWQLGAFTSESLGIETRLIYDRSAEICMTMAVSDWWFSEVDESAPPMEAFSAPDRESCPNIRMFSVLPAYSSTVVGDSLSPFFERTGMDFSLDQSVNIQIRRRREGAAEGQCGKDDGDHDAQCTVP
jgi:hypothetical protein